VLVLDADERIRLIVPEQDVVPGFEALDEVVFQEERFNLCIGDDDFHIVHLGDHDLEAPVVIPARMEIRVHPRAKVLGLAHIQHFPVHILVLVHTRFGREAG